MQPQRRVHTAINPHADHNNNNNNNNEHAHREVLHQAPPAHPHPHPPPTAALPQTLPDAPDATAAFMMKRFAKQTIEKGVAGLMEEFDTLQKRLQKNIPEHKYFDHNMDKNRYKGQLVKYIITPKQKSENPYFSRYILHRFNPCEADLATWKQRRLHPCQLDTRIPGAHQINNCHASTKGAVNRRFLENGKSLIS
jgi:hypothetical protein